MKSLDLKKLSVLYVILFCCLSCVSCSGKKYNLPVKTLAITTQDGQTVKCKAEIASKFEQRQYGFMNRKNIPEGTGMLFVFQKEQVLQFWMHDTPTALSIAYIDKNGTIRTIRDMKPFDETSISSVYYVLYALEVPQGWFAKNGIKEGDTIDLSPVL